MSGQLLAYIVPHYVVALIGRLRDAGRPDLARSVTALRVASVFVADDRCEFLVSPEEEDRIGATVLELAEEVLEIADGRIVHIEITGPTPVRLVLHGLTDSMVAAS